MRACHDQRHASSADSARNGSLDPQADPNRPLSPGGESWNDFLQRIRATLDDLPTRYPRQTVVWPSPHASFIVQVLTLFAVPALALALNPDFACITHWDSSESDRIWRLITHNDTAHLGNAS